MTTTPQQPGAEEAAVSSPETTSQSIEIPLSALSVAPAAGATISLRVVSVDEQAGVVNAVPVSETEEEPTEGGSDELAEEFNQQPE